MQGHLLLKCLGMDFGAPSKSIVVIGYFTIFTRKLCICHFAGRVMGEILMGVTIPLDLFESDTIVDVFNGTAVWQNYRFNSS